MAIKSIRKRKEYRELKIGEVSCYGERTVPQLRIQGLWLQDLGFQIGDPVRVKCEDRRIIITLDNIRKEMDEKESVEIRKLYDVFLKEKSEMHTQFVAERRAMYGEEIGEE